MLIGVLSLSLERTLSHRCSPQFRKYLLLLYRGVLGRVYSDVVFVAPSLCEGVCPIGNVSFSRSGAF
jgi:hypothetical protein